MIDLMGTMQYFHEHQVFERNMDATYIVLFPKKGGAVELRDFTPISLISVVYKIIAEDLAERLKRVIDNLVNEHQMAFVKERNYGCNLDRVSECIDATTRREVASVMCKLDIQKSYMIM